MSKRAKEQVHILRPSASRGGQSFTAKANGPRKPRGGKGGGFWDVLG